MVSYGQVRQWRPEPLDAAEQKLRKLSDRLLGLSDEFATMGTPNGWVGTAAESAKGQRTKVADRMEQIVAGVAAARTALMQGADAVAGLKHGVKEADGLAKAKEFQIGADGTVKDVAPVKVVSAEKVDDVARERDRIKAELVDRVEQILRRAHDIDSDLNGVLGKVGAGQITDGGANDLTSAAKAGAGQGGLSVLEPPPGKGTPGDNAGWWDTLSDEEKRQIIAKHPEWVGNRDGVPFTARDQANRTLLKTEKTRLLEEARLLQKKLDGNLFGGLFTNDDAKLAHIKAKLESIQKIEETLAKPGERQLLLLNMSEERAEAAVANGNVDTADHVAVFTPGLTSTVNGSLGGYDADMDQLQFRSEEELRRYGKNESVATISWIGYQAPQLTPHGLFLDEGTVLRDNAAEAGAQKLGSFYNGIDTARDNDAHLTALGHSYGSTTTGIALRQNTGVDDAVFFGSPGIGTSNISDIKVPDGHSNYIEARNDPVGDFARFGSDPSHMNGMQHGSSSAADLPGGRHGAEVTGHTSYLNDKSTSQYNMSVVVGGIPEHAVRKNNMGLGDGLNGPDPRNWW